MFFKINDNQIWWMSQCERGLPTESDLALSLPGPEAAHYLARRTQLLLLDFKQDPEVSEINWQLCYCSFSLPVDSSFII